LKKIQNHTRVYTPPAETVTDIILYVSYFLGLAKQIIINPVEN
jgi:hypothetical protein